MIFFCVCNVIVTLCETNIVLLGDSQCKQSVSAMRRTGVEWCQALPTHLVILCVRAHLSLKCCYLFHVCAGPGL